MEFYDPSEELAVAQICQRVRESPDGEYNDWMPYQIESPSQMRVVVNWERQISFGARLPGQTSVTRLDPIQQFVKFREEIIRDFPSFVVIEEWNNELQDIETSTDWMFDLANAAHRHELKPVMGYGYHNSFQAGKRRAKRIGLVKLVEPASGIYVETSDSSQLYPAQDPDDEPRILKLLFIHNAAKPAPYRMRMFIKALRRVFIDDLKYSWAYGHCATVDQPDHPHNCTVDKRFERHSTWRIEMEDGTVEQYRESNLCWYWQTMGLLAAPSPETDNELTVGLMAESYSNELLKIAPKVWKQVFARAR